MDDEEKAKKRADYELGQDLSDMSVDELSDMIVLMKEEITRLEAAKAQKSDHLSAAEALFKS